MNNYHIKGRKVDCKLCGRIVGAHNYSRVDYPDPARHKCPHSEPCRFSLDDCGPSCKRCRDERGFPRKVLAAEVPRETCAGLPVRDPVVDVRDALDHVRALAGPVLRLNMAQVLDLLARVERARCAIDEIAHERAEHSYNVTARKEQVQ